MRAGGQNSLAASARFGLSLSKVSLCKRGGIGQAQPKVSLLIGAVCLNLAVPAAARVDLGLFNRWAAFRDARPTRCYAIAEPVRATSKNARWRPFASVASWPGGPRNQLHIRLRRPANGRATLGIAGRRFPLIAGGADAWAPDARADAAIVAAMRSADRMTVSAGGISDTYPLRGAATAIDAATLGCVRR